MNHPQTASATAMADEVLDGLQNDQKSLPSKFFYDETGSRLFEKITEVEEYYPTRTEQAIMEQHIGEISDAIGDRAAIIEPGSGSSKKVHLLLDHLPDVAAYIPVEISEAFLKQVVSSLKSDYPDLPIKPVYADYTQPFSLPDMSDVDFKYYTVFYPGSTIGNFSPAEAQNFLELLAGFLKPGGGLLIGVDVKKDVEILEAAYDDTAGITAKFNKNILRHINRMMEANFVLDNFDHKAIYNQEKGRIEMHLVSCCEHTVTVDGQTIEFDAGETIHTENSYKYAPEEFADLADEWFDVQNVWMDDDQLFSVQYLVKK